MKISEILLRWYKKNRRDLPWRNTSDPYLIWLSEVILQQTRVTQGLDYFLAFKKAFPDIFSLARAEEQEILKLWQGLGYYSRARNLHETAREVAEQMDGLLPQTYDSLLKLKGVGPYTAAAIASISFHEARAVVDGNVSRVISRLFGIEIAINSSSGIKMISSHAGKLLEKKDPGTYNQAIMEFGALQCVPVSPDCKSCPLINRCMAFQSGRVTFLPVKKPRRKPVVRWMYYFIFLKHGDTVLTLRKENDIWRSLYQFPLIESDQPLPDVEILERMTKEFSLNPDRFTVENISATLKHQLTHQSIRARFVHLKMEQWPDPVPGDWNIISGERVDDFPIPTLINRYVETHWGKSSA